MTVEARAIRWDREPSERVNESISRTLFTGERVMMARVLLSRGAVVPVHRHEHEQMTFVLEGALRFQVGEAGSETEMLVRTGEVVLFPSNVPHQGVAEEDTVVLDVFSPPRQDWIDRTDDYLRQGPRSGCEPR